MLTPVERVLILKSADLLKDVGPRHLLSLADVAREMEISKGETLYKEEDPADALYIVVEGRVRLSTGGQTTSEVGPGEAFGTWALVDDSSRGHRAECLEDGLALALLREDFYDQASGDPALLQEIIRVLAKRLRSLVSDRPEEARVESEGLDKQPEAPAPGETSAAPPASSSLEAAALGKPETQTPPPGGSSTKPGGRSG